MNEFEAISAEIRQFILEKIDSVPHLEALLLLWKEPARVWTEESLARALYVRISVARRVMQVFSRRNWIKESQVPNGFVYDGSWDPDGSFMSRLAETYARQLVRVATLIHSNASAGVREFADAFNLKKE